MKQFRLFARAINCDPNVGQGIYIYLTTLVEGSLAFSQKNSGEARGIGVYEHVNVGRPDMSL